jgi:beta-lactamase regulating signal transducer with metallopeptidase domain
MKRLLICLLSVLCLLVPVSASAAYNPFTNACHAGGGTEANKAAGDSTPCSATGKNPLTGSDGYIRKISNILAVIGAVVAVILIMYAGFRYITAAGDAQKIANARNVIVGALVGLAVIATAQAIVIFVVSKL